MRTEWWSAFRLPVNWKLAEEAFMEQYHVLETHPQLRIPGRYAPASVRRSTRTFVEAELHYLRTMSDGMAGMVHANDVRIAERMRDIELPGAGSGHGDLAPCSTRRSPAGTARRATTSPISTSSKRAG